MSEVTWPVGKDPTPKMIAAMRREIGEKQVRAWLSDREVACMFKAAISTAANAAKV